MNLRDPPLPSQSPPSQIAHLKIHCSPATPDSTRHTLHSTVLRNHPSHIRPPCLSRTVSPAASSRSPSLTVADTVAFADKFPSSAAFETINEALTASDADRKDAIKQGNAIFAFTLKNAAGETESWHIDLKNKGEVGKGLGEKPTGKIQPIYGLCDQSSIC